MCTCLVFFEKNWGKGSYRAEGARRLNSMAFESVFTVKSQVHLRNHLKIIPSDNYSTLNRAGSSFLLTEPRRTVMSLPGRSADC